MSSYQRDLVEALLDTTRQQAAASEEHGMIECLDRQLDSSPEAIPEKLRVELYQSIMQLVRTSIAKRNFSTKLMQIELALAILALVDRGEHLDHVNTNS